jgi:hypothetical protein
VDYSSIIRVSKLAEFDIAGLSETAACFSYYATGGKKKLS